MFYSPDAGDSWQQLADNVADLADLSISPYLPLTVLDVRDHQVYALDLPEAGASLTRPAEPLHSQATRFFPETGQNLGPIFAAYWAGHGGLAPFGYPLTTTFDQMSTPDGRVYTVQYFERAVLESHPENAPPYTILPRRLGAAAYQQRYGPAGTLNQHASPDLPRVFPETGHTVGGVFRAYWESHGGLAQQGYPLSEELVETNPDDGQSYIVQYFERAVFEHHAEYAGTPYEVLLRPMGRAQLQQWASGRALP